MESKNSKSDWLKYEELAALIYSKLEPNSTVKHNDKIYGNISERTRQIDVSIRTNIAGHELLIIVDAKDRSRAPDIKTIESFSKTMEDVAASKGVIVCRKKPSENNLKVAAKYGIEICTAIDIKDHNWKEEIKVPLLVNLKDYEVQLGFKIIQKGNMHFELPSKWLISQNNGKTHERIGQYVLNVLAKYDTELEHFTLTANNNLSISVASTIDKHGWHPLEYFQINVKQTKRSVFRYPPPQSLGCAE